MSQHKIKRTPIKMSRSRWSPQRLLTGAGLLAVVAVLCAVLDAVKASNRAKLAVLTYLCNFVLSLSDVPDAMVHL